jgi:hypothetical protein
MKHPFVCPVCGLRYATEIALKIWCEKRHKREMQSQNVDHNDAAPPWNMTPLAWEIFKIAPEKWKEEVERGRLILLADGSLSTPAEEAKRQDAALRAWVEQDVIDESGRVVWKAKKKPKK